MKWDSQKRKRKVAMLFMTSLMFMLGHVSLLNPQVTQAVTVPSSNTLVHHDTTEHQSEKHNPCPTELHEFSYARTQEFSTEICGFVFSHVHSQIFDSVLVPFIPVGVIFDEHLPVRLPLAQKTHLLI